MVRSDKVPVPSVAILIAMRNEEANISACLLSLAQQDYPSHAMTVFIGDDNSQDHSYEVANRQVLPNWQVIKVPEAAKSLPGKAGVLAYLWPKTQADYVLLTDADCVLAPTWVSTMVSKLESKRHVAITGPTLVQPSSAFTHLQVLEWLCALQAIDWLQQVGVVVTGVGSNLAVNRKEIERLGGYAALTHGINEDVALFQALKQLKEPIHFYLEPSVVVRTVPHHSLPDWLSQHIRWLKGGLTTGIASLITLFGQVLAYLITPVLVFISPRIGLPLFVAHYAFVVLTACIAAVRLKAKASLPWVGLLYFYFALLYPAMIVAFLFHKKIDWKGREYLAGQ